MLKRILVVAAFTVVALTFNCSEARTFAGEKLTAKSDSSFFSKFTSVFGQPGGFFGGTQVQSRRSNQPYSYKCEEKLVRVIWTYEDGTILTGWRLTVVCSY